MPMLPHAGCGVRLAPGRQGLVLVNPAVGEWHPGLPLGAKLCYDAAGWGFLVLPGGGKSWCKQLLKQSVGINAEGRQFSAVPGQAAVWKDIKIQQYVDKFAIVNEEITLTAHQFEVPRAAMAVWWDLRDAQAALKLEITGRHQSQWLSVHFEAWKSYWPWINEQCWALSQRAAKRRQEHVGLVFVSYCSASLGLIALLLRWQQVLTKTARSRAGQLLEGILGKACSGQDLVWHFSTEASQDHWPVVEGDAIRVCKAMVNITDIKLPSFTKLVTRSLGVEGAWHA